MRKESSRVALAAIGGCFLLITFCLPSRLSAQGAAPRPEYFGFYALDGGKLIAIGDGKSDTPPTLQQVIVAVLGAAQPTSRSAVQLGTGSSFLLFDISPADAGRAISIYGLPFVRKEYTVPDTPFGSTTVRQRDLPGMMRLAQSQIRLLQKPVPSQPQMIELVPDPPLARGLYGVLFAPATGIAVGGAGAGQRAGWTALLLITGQASVSEGGAQCIDLILTGGLGGMLGMDSPDMGSIASFPLLDPGRAPACSASDSSASVAPASPAAAPSTPAAKGPTMNLADLQSTIEAGKEVSFPVKYNSAIFGYVYMAEGVVTLSKTTFAFRGTVGATDFNVSPDKVLELNWRLLTSSDKPAFHVKVAIMNKKGTKEDKKDYYFYSAGASAVGGGPGGEGASISCSACDDSMNLLSALLTKLR
jgi:hypothetical protein